ncbi:hypothetical protein TURU_015585 [Turdus rufiventris]|nr:hypothetical protein TURU_015585 [Turdus rufiventris]
MLTGSLKEKRVSPKVTTKVIRGMEHLSYEKRVREFWIVRLGEEKALAFQYLRRAYKKDGEGIFMRTWSDRTRGNGFKLKENDIAIKYDYDVGILLRYSEPEKEKSFAKIQVSQYIK